MYLAWSDALTTGTFVLVGVVIGAIVGAVVQGYFEWRRGEEDVRQATRQIAEDVLRVAIHYDGMATSKSTPQVLGGGEATFLPSGAWNEYGPVLARHWKPDRDDDYDTLSMFMGGLPVMRDLLAREPANNPLSTLLLERVEEGRHLSYQCYTILTGKPIPDE